MSPFLEMLYDASFGYNDAPLGPDPAYAEQNRIKLDALAALKVHLTGAQKGLFETFYEADDQVEEFCLQQKFSYGFHLGALLMLEVMEGREKMCG